MALIQIEGYETISALGEGGMGAVYRAREIDSGREVALKVLKRALADDEEFVLRFKREAAALGALSHASIARLYSTGFDGDVLYFAMEFVEGEALSERIADGPLGLNEALAIVAEVADGLDAAHAAGIIHRDVKPSNIILSPAGAKMTDFGLARKVDASGLTTSGRIVGSLAYMSPEQIQGETLTPASDVYSLGVVLYEALSGKLPFDADDEAALATRILTEPAPMLTSGKGNIPPTLNVLIVRMLAKDTNLRPASAADVAARLRDVAEGKTPTPAGGAGSGGKWWSHAAAALSRAALRLLPVTAWGDALAERVARFARSAAVEGCEMLLLEASLLKRGVKKAARELKALERKRNDRLRRAAEASARAESADAEEKQSLQRLARELTDEAALFEKRIAAVAKVAVEKRKQVDRLEEKARGML